MNGASATPFVRRATTLPTVFQPAAAARPSTARQDRQSANLQSETLFECSSSKIYSFPADLARLSTSAARGTHETAKLPWTHPHERVRAAGPVRLYRLPGSVCFLNSGDLLLSFMPRSQCWCVDGISKFAIKVKMEIYRIELPTGMEGDLDTVEAFKDVLSNIIQFEKTACPFQRGFGHDLPEDTTELARSRPRGPVTQARKWVSDAGWRPEDMDPEAWRARNKRRTSPGVSDDGSRTNGIMDEHAPAGEPMPAPATIEDDEEPQIKSLGAGAYRSFTLPHKYNFNHGDPFALSQQRPEPSPLDQAGTTSDTRMPRLSVQSPAEKVTVAERVNGLSSADPPVGSVSETSAKNRSTDGVVQTPRLLVAKNITDVVENVPESDDSSPLPEAKVQPSAADASLSQTNEGNGPHETACDAKSVTAETSEHDSGESIEQDETLQASAGSSEQPEVPRVKVKQVKIEEPVMTDSSAPSEEIKTVDEVTGELEKHSLKTAESVQSFHTTRTGLSPKESYASFRPILETIEADVQEIDGVRENKQEVAEEGPAVAKEEMPAAAIEEMPAAATTLSTPTKTYTTLESPPSASPAEPPATAPRERRLRALHPKHSQSLMSAQSLRRQPSISFTNRDGEPTDMPGELISKTIALLTGPPSGLLAVMVQIAAQIARGAFGSDSAAFRYREGRTRKDGYKWMPGGWESDDEWDEDDGRDDVSLVRDDEDDYGVPLGCDTPSRARRKDWGKELVTRTD